MKIFVHTAIVTIITSITVLSFVILTQIFATRAEAFIPKGTETCTSCQRQGKQYLCFDTVAITYFCDSAPSDIPNVRCNICGENIAIPTPTQTQFCAQVLTPARNLQTRECQTFSTSCLPDGWVRDDTCAQGATPTPTISSPTPTPLTTGTYCRTNADCSLNQTCVNNFCSTTSTTTPATTPPTAACALKSSGDANCDGGIDLLDFNIWRDEFLGLPIKYADFNADGKADLLDFNVWRTSFVSGSWR